MQKFLTWTLDTIREEGSSFSWMEEYRYEWTPLVLSAVSKIIKGQTVLIVTDDNCRWFGKYITSRINHKNLNRPFLPIFPLETIFPNFKSLDTTLDLELLEDMLDISYPSGYFIWYIGKKHHPYSKFAYRSDENFLWTLNNEVPNGFRIRASDELLDIRLLQLFKLFNKTIDIVLFGEMIHEIK